MNNNNDAISSDSQSSGDDTMGRLEAVMTKFASSIETLECALHGRSDALTIQYLSNRLLRLNDSMDNVLKTVAEFDGKLIDMATRIAEISARVDKAARAFASLSKGTKGNPQTPQQDKSPTQEKSHGTEK